MHPARQLRCSQKSIFAHVKNRCELSLLACSLWFAPLPGLAQADFLQVLQQDSNFAAASESSRSYIHYGEVALLNAGNLGDIANIGVLVGQQSIAIIDSGGSPKVTEQLLSEIQNISTLPISFIIITHAHPDHWMGLPTLLAKTNAQLVVNKAFVPALMQRMAQDVAMFGDETGQGSEQTGILTSFALENYADRIQAVDEGEGATINIGDRSLHLRALPASHTNHDLALWDVVNRVMWVGDMFFVDHVPTFEANFKGLQASRRVIEEYSPDLIVSGHGQPMPDWHGKWKKQWHYYDTLKSTVRQRISEGASMQAVLAEAEQISRTGDDSSNDLAAFDGWRLMETFHPRNVTRAYQALEWD